MKRKVLLLVPLLLLIGWSFYQSTRSSAPVGSQLLHALPQLPQAIATLDYFPPTSLGAPPEVLTSGAFPSPDPALKIESYQLDSVTLVIPRRATALLRARLASRDSDPMLRGAVGELGYRFEAPDGMLASARQTLLAQSDLGLLQEYLRADRFTLAHCGDLDRAVQLAMLLVTTPFTGVAATFQIRGHTYYLLTTRDDLAARPVTTTVLCFAPDGKEFFHGILGGPRESLLPTLYRFAQSLTPPAGPASAPAP